MLRQTKQELPNGVTLEDVTRAVLYSIGQTYDEHITFPSQEARDAAVLWIAHTWVLEAFSATPRLSVRSMEPGSGKSVVLEVGSYMTPHPANAVCITPGVLWRLMPERPTMFLDEADTIFGKNGSGTAHMMLRAVINAGYRRGATIMRIAGAEGINRFPVFGAIALAGLGRLPDTIASRSVEIEMRRRKAGDKPVKPFRPAVAEPALKILRDRCEAWSKPAIEALRYAVTEVPASNRAAEIWEPLLAVADLAGEEWSKRGRAACKALTAVSAGKPTSLGVQLLIDIRTVMSGRDRMTSADLLTALLSIEDGVWEPDNLDSIKVARMLSPYGIRPKALKVGAATRQGYLTASFEDTWNRYLVADGAEFNEPVGAV